MQKILSIILILFFLSLGIIFFWWPKYADFDNLKFQIKEKRIQLENKEQYFSELENLSLEFKKYSSELSKIDSALPATPGIPDLLHFLEKTGSQNGLVLERVNLEPIYLLQENPSIKKISLAISFSGPYPSFKNFLSTLQKSARLLEIELISFSSPARGENFSFDLKIKTYSY